MTVYNSRRLRHQRAITVLAAILVAVVVGCTTEPLVVGYAATSSPPKPSGQTAVRNDPGAASADEFSCPDSGFRPEPIPSTSASAKGPSPASSVFQKAKRPVRECFQAELSRNACVEGRLNITLALNSAGYVIGVGVAQPSGNFSEMAKRCVADVFVNLQFPAPAGSASTVEASFTLQNSGARKTDR